MDAKHQPPEWMLRAPLIQEWCADCRKQLRYAEKQTFCIFCWEYRTRQMIDRARQSLEIAKKRMRDAETQSILEDDTNGYRIYQDEAATTGDWKAVMQFKWRVVVLETTGKRLPMVAFDA